MRRGEEEGDILERENLKVGVMEIYREREKRREEEDQNFWCKLGKFRVLDEMRK